MELSVLFMGSVGVGKTAAIRAISDIDVVDTDMIATDVTATLKERTTVTMDVGTLDLGGDDRLRVFGAPGQDRFDFMWDILLEQARSIALLVNHTCAQPLAELDYFLGKLTQRLAGRSMPVAVGVTHTEHDPHFSVAPYVAHLACRKVNFADAVIPVFSVDARRRNQVRALVVALAAMQEASSRFGIRRRSAALER